MNNNNFYLTEPYKEPREKAEKDLDSWPNKAATRKRNRAVIGISCLGLSIAIIIIWIGTYYAVRTNAIATLPQTQAAPHSRNGF